MEYFKCDQCWRVYEKEQLLKGPHDFCTCGSQRFRNSQSCFLRRLFTAFRYTSTLWNREKLGYEKTS